MSTPFYDLASLVLVPSGYKAQKVYAQKPLTTDGQLTFSRASTATRVNSAGLIETVSSNVPRLDYLGSTCPKLLLEPQRTNLVQYSEQFDNAAWSKDAFGTGVTPAVTANATASPDGTTNADLIVFDSGAGTTTSDYSIVSSSGFSMTNGTSYTTTFYAKGASASQQIIIRLSIPGQWAGNYEKITITNQWARYSFTQAAGATGTGNVDLGIRRGLSEPLNASASINFYGFQTEAGAYATSYVKTTTAAVTRLADECSKTGISSLIGQTEGTLFIDVVPTDLSGLARYISIESASGVNSGWIGIFASGSNTFRFYGDGFDFQAGATVRGTRYKVAMAYKNGVLTSAYINGTSAGTLTANTAGRIYANLKLANAEIGNFGCSDFFQSLIFKTALTNAQLAELTTL